MKIKDIRFTHDTPSSYLRHMITRKPIPGIESEEKTLGTIRKLIRRASDTDELIGLIIDCDDLAGTSERAFVMKYERPNMIWREIRAIMGDRCIKTTSDAGAVRVGTDGFSAMIPNCRGDGITRVAVFDETPEGLKPFLNTVMRFELSLSGTFNIYDYDCEGGKLISEISGKYGAYAYDGLVIFEKWN